MKKKYELFQQMVNKEDPILASVIRGAFYVAQGKHCGDEALLICLPTKMSFYREYLREHAMILFQCCNVAFGINDVYFEFLDKNIFLDIIKPREKELFIDTK